MCMAVPVGRPMWLRIRRGKRTILVPVDPATHDAFRDLAAELNSTAEYLGHEALKLLFEKKGKPVPCGVEERLSSPVQVARATANNAAINRTLHERRKSLPRIKHFRHVIERSSITSRIIHRSRVYLTPRPRRRRSFRGLLSFEGKKFDLWLPGSPPLVKRNDMGTLCGPKRVLWCRSLGGRRPTHYAPHAADARGSSRQAFNASRRDLRSPATPRGSGQETGDSGEAFRRTEVPGRPRL